MARTSSGGRVTGEASGRRPPLTRGRKAASDKSASAPSVNGREEPLVVFFDDIRLVRDLLGDYDANLAVLEDRLGLQAVAHDLVFATGPAGTGKTYLAVAFAASCLESGKCDRLILSRPAVEAGERLGFLPGDMREKVDPYLRPLYDALYDVLAPERVERGL